MKKLPAFLEVLRKGVAVADPALWKNVSSATMAAVAGLIVALVKLAKVYGYDLPIDDEAAYALAGGIIVAVGVYFNYATSTTVGVLPAKHPDDVQVEDKATDSAADAVPGPNSTRMP